MTQTYDLGLYDHGGPNRWSEAYDVYRLMPLAEYDLPLRWNEYRRWVGDHGKDLRKGHQDHLDSALRNIADVFRSSGGRYAAVREELHSLLERLDWPRESKLERLVKECVSSDTVPDPRVVEADWRKFQRQVEDYRLGRPEDLAHRTIVFPRLGR